MTSLLKLTGVSSGYKDIPVLRNIDLEVLDQEFIGVFGHNGMGKSTLLKTIIGHIRLKQGSIEFKGREVSAKSVAERAKLGIGYVPQGRQIYPNLTTLENLSVAQMGTRKNARPLEEIFDYLPRLRPIRDRMGGVLSGGEQQILALGRCLVSRPALMLLDEPTEGIQPSIRDEIIEVLLELKQKDNFAMILVEQNLDFLKALADKLVVLQKGQITTGPAGMEINESLDAAFSS